MVQCTFQASQSRILLRTPSPDLNLQVYNTTYIRWTTHSPKGLSEKDLDMAAICDALAKDFSEIASDDSNADMASLASEATAIAGDCCVPKKK